ncbi:MAG: hypothetical protein FWG46_02820 [Treponema sp.]|nr:hypothetical protein [Treponema sp.]
MPVVKFRSAIFIISLLCSAGLWVLGASLAPAGRGGGYAALVFSEEVPDREIRSRLENSGLSGMVCESGQWFLLDCFGGIEQIPLDEFGVRLLPFDPRNDGYAEKLRSLFIQDGRRMVYVPAGLTSPANTKKIAAALDGIPHTVEYETRRRPLLLPLLLFCVFSAAFFLFRPLRSALKPNAAALLPCLPVLAPLTWWGAAGFALAALLAGCAAYLVSYGSKRRLFLPAIFIVCYCLTAILSGLPFVFALCAYAASAFVFLLSSRKTDDRSAGGVIHRPAKRNLGKTAPETNKTKKSLSFGSSQASHRRFAPVTIIGRQPVNTGFALAMLPFAAASLLLAIIAAATPAAVLADPSFTPPAGIVSEQDYNDHALFQSTFSFRTLHIPTGGFTEPAGMSAYRLAVDGLPDLAAAALPGDGIFSPELHVPPFPLGNFLRELGKMDGNAVRRTASASGVPELYLALVPLLFILPCLFVNPPGRRKKTLSLRKN